MTSENEKEMESSKKNWQLVLDTIKQNYLVAEEDTRISDLTHELDQLWKNFVQIQDKKEQVQFYRQVRFVANLLDAAQNNLISRNQDYQLAIRLEQLGNQISGLPPTPSLEEQGRKLREQVEKLVDDQIAKRVAQISRGDTSDYIG